MRALFKIPRNLPPTFRKSNYWSPVYEDFVKGLKSYKEPKYFNLSNVKILYFRCLVKDFEKRPNIDELLQHPFLTQVPENTDLLKEKLKLLVENHSSTIVLLKKRPEVTTKNGKFKSKRKSKRHSPYTVDDLASLENFDEVKYYF